MKPGIPIIAEASRQTLIEILAAGFCLELFALAIPIFSQVIFDKVITHNSASTLNIVAFGLLVVFLFQAGLQYLHARHLHIYSDEIERILTRSVTNQLLRLPLSFFEEQQKGEVVTRLTQIKEIRAFLTAAFIGGVLDALFMLVIMVLLFFYSVQLALVVSASIPVLAVLTFAMKPKVKHLYKELDERRMRYNATITEGITNITTIKESNLERFWNSRWNKASEEFLRIRLAAKRSAAIDDTLVGLVQRLCVLSVLWIGASLSLSGSLSAGQLVACYMLSLRVLLPTTRIFNIWSGLEKVHEERERLSEFLGTPPEQEDSKECLPFPDDCQIQLSGVAFRYKADSPDVLKDISLTVPQGEFIGIMGRSGSGKTTLLKLVQRHLQPRSGFITLGGADTRYLDITVLRSVVQHVTQESVLFRGRIADNLRANAPEADLADLVAACKITQADRFISALPKGYDTPLGERATQLSSGQKQRLAIARAILGKPRVLILDEATNALDAGTEHAVLDALKTSFPAMGLIVVTHRAATLRNADHVYTLADGTLSHGITSQASAVAAVS